MIKKPMLSILILLMATIFAPIYAQDTSPEEVEGNHCLVETPFVRYEGVFDPNTTPQSATNVPDPQVTGCYDTFPEAMRVLFNGRLIIPEDATEAETTAYIHAYINQVTQPIDSLYLASPLANIPYLKVWEGNNQSPSHKSRTFHSTRNCEPGIYMWVPDLRQQLKPYFTQP